VARVVAFGPLSRAGARVERMADEAVRDVARADRPDRLVVARKRAVRIMVGTSSASPPRTRTDSSRQ
jgi:hypothetical protein